MALSFLYYDDGVFYAYDMATGKSADLTSKIPAKFWDTEDDHNVVKPPRQSLGWSKDSAAVLLSDGWDIWKVPVAGGQAVNLTVNGGKDKIRYRRTFRLDPEERGIDLDRRRSTSPSTANGPRRAASVSIEPGKPGVRMLQWGDAAYTQLIKAKSADVYLIHARKHHRVSQLSTSPTRLWRMASRVTDANPQQKDFLWPKGVKLVDYSSTRGEKLQAALYLPANYQPGKHYPTIVYIYEKLSQGANAYPQPGYNGFNIAHYTSNGYAVLEPDIVYKVNDPGMSAVACVVPAVKAAIATGIVDAAAVGLQGHSWGGYQTAFLVTQTDIFHAAIAGAPLTDMVSMYSLIYRNTGGTNQAIFESSQGRFAGGYWDNMEAYIRNSPVYHAKNVKTPLIILANDKDGAVDQTQGIAYFNTLRRLDKPVIMLEYKGENHGLRLPKNMKDYTVRMREWFDHYLKDAASPDWMEKGSAAPADERSPGAARHRIGKAGRSETGCGGGRRRQRPVTFLGTAGGACVRSGSCRRFFCTRPGRTSHPYAFGRQRRRRLEPGQRGIRRGFLALALGLASALSYLTWFAAPPARHARATVSATPPAP